MIRQQPGDQRRGVGERFVAVRARPDAAWIPPREKTRPAGCANRVLAVGMRKGDTIRAQTVQVRRVDMWVVQAMNRVESLHIGGEP